MDKNLFGEDITHVGTLRERYGEVPVSILDTTTKHWIARKNKWLSLGIKSEENRVIHKPFSKNCAKFQGGRESHKHVSVFDATLTELMYKWFCPSNSEILDPFAGGSVRGIIANYLGHKYTGVELRNEQVESNRQQGLDILDVNNQPQWLVGDSEDLISELQPKYDMIFSCPPYFNLEIYSKLPDDLSNMNYDQFKIKYKSIIEKSCDKLKDNSFAIFVVGEVRDKNGYYLDFVGYTKRCFMEYGLVFYNEMILKNNIGSAAIRVPVIFERNRKIVKVHQNVLVFKKMALKKPKREGGNIKN
jgi:tRNA1(Val) A37 N6-methylase TrmN6